jgi:hypothetical protein
MFIYQSLFGLRRNGVQTKTKKQFEITTEEKKNPKLTKVYNGNHF